MTRVLVCTSEYPPGPGGIGTQAAQLVQGLARRGWEVSVVARQEGTTREARQQFAARHPIPLLSVPELPTWPGRAAASAAVIAGAIARYRPQVVLASGDRIVQVTSAITGLARVPWVAIEHGRTPLGRERAMKRFAVGRADAVVCVSHYTRDQLLAMGARPRRTEVIGNGADEATFVRLPASERDQLRAVHPHGARKLIVTVGSVTARKGQEVVVRALPEVVAAGVDAHYLCVGRPTEAPRIEAIARDLGVAERVTFVGIATTEQIVQTLNLADVFAMTSRHTHDEFEGFGIAVVEAALCGLPAVVSNGSGLRDAIVEGTTGLGVPEDDAHATAQALIALLGNPARQRAMGEAARAHALAELCWSHVVARYDRVLAEVA